MGFLDLPFEGQLLPEISKSRGQMLILFKVTAFNRISWDLHGMTGFALPFPPLKPGPGNSGRDLW